MSQKNPIWDTFSPMPALNYGGKFTKYEKLIFLNMLLCIRYLKSSPLTPKPYPHPGKCCFVSEKSNMGQFQGIGVSTVVGGGFNQIRRNATFESAQFLFIYRSKIIILYIILVQYAEQKINRYTLIGNEIRRKPKYQCVGHALNMNAYPNLFSSLRYPNLYYDENFIQDESFI